MKVSISSWHTVNHRNLLGKLLTPQLYRTWSPVCPSGITAIKIWSAAEFVVIQFVLCLITLLDIEWFNKLSGDLHWISPAGDNSWMPFASAILKPCMCSRELGYSMQVAWQFIESFNVKKGDQTEYELYYYKFSEMWHN